MTTTADFILGSTGMVFETAALKAPDGFLFCYGQAVSRTTYAKLFAALSLSLAVTTTSGSASVSAATVDITTVGLIGAKVEGTGIAAGTTITAATSTTLTLSANATASASNVALTIIPWGNGDGSTTFNLPDRRGRAGVGRDGMGGTPASRITTAATGINGAALAASGGEQAHVLDVTEMPSHSHNLASGNTSAVGSNGRNPQAGGSYIDAVTNTGGGLAHNNVQPTIIFNYMIKT